MAFFEFPYTRTYDSDLGWLIRAFKHLNVDVETLQSWYEQHAPEYQELKDKVDGLVENLVDVIVPWDSSIEYHIYSIVEWEGQNYIALQNVPVGVMITNTDYWQPANTTVEQINAIGQTVNETIEIVNDVSEAIQDLLTVDPDKFEGTDSQKLQAAIDEIGDTDSGVVVLRRMYTLTDNVIFRTHSLRRTLRMVGVSNQAGFTMGAYHFEGDHAAAGGIFFDNVYFTGGTDKVFAIGANLIRLNFTNCFFYNCADIFAGDYAQQVRLVNCRLAYFGTLFKTSGQYGCLSCSVISCDMEDGHALYINESGGSDANVLFADSCAESFDGPLIQYGAATSDIHNVTVRGCYFEFIRADRVIDLTNGGNNPSSVFVVSDNYFREATGYQGEALVYISGNGFGNAHITIEDNQCIPAASAVILSLPNRTVTLRFLTRGRNVGQYSDPNNRMPIHNFTDIAGQNYITVSAPFSPAGDVAYIPLQIYDYPVINLLAVRTANASGDLDVSKFTLTRTSEDGLTMTCSNPTLSAGKTLIAVFRASHN